MNYLEILKIYEKLFIKMQTEKSAAMYKLSRRKWRLIIKLEKAVDAWCKIEEMIIRSELEPIIDMLNLMKKFDLAIAHSNPNYVNIENTDKLIKEDSK